jgi:sortase B
MQNDTPNQQNSHENAQEDIQDSTRKDAQESTGKDTQENNQEKFQEKSQDITQTENLRRSNPIFPVKGDSTREIVRKIIFLVSFVVFIVAAVVFVSTLLQSRRAIADEKVNVSVANTTVATTVNDEGVIVTIPPTREEEEEHNFNLNDYFLNITPEYAGYIWLDGCDISDPVVQAADNEKYLDTTYYGEHNKAGAIFMDYRCVVTADYMSPNIVLYGHNQEDGTMFGDLKEYKNNVEFYKANPFVKFNTRYDIGEYVIYGFFVTNALEQQDSNGEVFRYHDYIETMNTEATFNWYQAEVARRNQIIPPVDLQFGDQLLTLSTCSTEFKQSRFVVFARKLRPGETKESFDFSETIYNTNAKGYDWDAIMGLVTTEPVATTVTLPSETALLITRPVTVDTTTAATTAATSTADGAAPTEPITVATTITTQPITTAAPVTTTATENTTQLFITR